MNEFANSMRLVLSSLGNTRKTQKQIITETKISPRTFRFAISRLKRMGLVKEYILISDTRIKVYKRGEFNG